MPDRKLRAKIAYLRVLLAARLFAESLKHPDNKKEHHDSHSR